MKMVKAKGGRVSVVTLQRQSSMSWRSREARSEARDDNRRVRSKNVVHMKYVSGCVATSLPWPMMLMRGNVEFGRQEIMTASERAARNDVLEDRFIAGKTDRLWSWKILYWPEYDKICKAVADRIPIEVLRGERTLVDECRRILGEVLDLPITDQPEHLELRLDRGKQKGR